MNGYQISFYMQQNDRHDGHALCDWLVKLAGELELRGVTVIAGTEGIGHDGRLHSAHFFELGDQPVKVMMAVNEEQSDKLFARLKGEKLRLFYIKAPVEFGVVGED
ncbi:DUF190 domain-containing protein [Solimonas marina]|uniref:DUF190 domain-containing protein n=1 Tax=Solimonas marina TaxID=2714601 RepID=A0A969WCL9_9GAMM|nr:DUF190 domain-containing protein [Solimonas marina]NKF23749.1 DUF190 domain-containing protein [Solimonas marina]